MVSLSTNTTRSGRDFGQAGRKAVVAGVFALVLSVASGCTQASNNGCTGAACAGQPGTPTQVSQGSVTSVGSKPVKLLVVVLENHSAQDISQGMPQLVSAANQYGRASQSYGASHPSLPNYLTIAGGSNFGVQDDNLPAVHPLSGSSVFGQVLAAGKVAKTYAEGMPTNCAVRSSGRYAVKHNPWAYFTAEHAACRRYDVPAGTPVNGALHNDIAAGTLPTFGLLVPDLCHDAHDCSLGTADSWLQGWLRPLLAGPDFRSGRLAVVVTFDEDDHRSGNHIFTAVLHTSLHGKNVTTHLDHLALSRAASGLVGQQGLRDAAGATNLLAAFGLAARR
jgi:hypothetical protein